MSKIVFFCIPAHGHTNPTLGVVRELIQRGHMVWYYSYTPFREEIEGLGATFIACDDYDTEQKLTPKDAARIGKDLALSTQVLVDTTLALDDMVCQQMQALKPDCIVADSMAVWGKAVALKLGIPFVSSTTTFAFNQHSAKIMKQSPTQMLGMLFSMPKINRDIKRLQDKGYPVRSVLDILQNDNQTDTIVYTSPEFQPCSETFSDRYVFVGPSVRPVTEEIIKKKTDLYLNGDCHKRFLGFLSEVHLRIRWNGIPGYYICRQFRYKWAEYDPGKHHCKTLCRSDRRITKSGRIFVALRHEQRKRKSVLSGSPRDVSTDDRTVRRRGKGCAAGRRNPTKKSDNRGNPRSSRTCAEHSLLPQQCCRDL